VKRVYFAGKVDSYRKHLFATPRVMSAEPGTVVVLRNGGHVIYGGPNAISCGHGCWHDEPHGIFSTKTIEGECEHYPPETVTMEELGNKCPTERGGLNGRQGQEGVIRRCFSQIDQADAVHAYIDSDDCHGTLIELGYAAAKGKPIHLVISMCHWNGKALPPCAVGPTPHIHVCPPPPKHLQHPAQAELWFALDLPTVSSLAWGGPRDIHISLCSQPVRSTVEQLERLFDP
jgi:hypothetical protein